MSIDRWHADEYQDNVFWTQQYFDAKEQWGGTGGTYVPEAVYQIATYATGLTAEDFGQVEFASYERDILYTTVQILGEGLRAGSTLPPTTAAPATDAALAPASTHQASDPGLLAWLYQYDPRTSAKCTALPPALTPAAIDALMTA